MKVGVPEPFRPHIAAEYPPHNKIIFEEWFAEKYKGCETDRLLLDINFTSYWVNNNYGNDEQARKFIQAFVDSLGNSRKYFCIIQYDDGAMIDWKGKDVLEFNMSKKMGIEMPLLCQPHPYIFSGNKKWFGNFVGSRTHPIRNHADKLNNGMGYYISFEPHTIENYCRIMYESMFTLCFRGYGLNSFRIAEAMQYGSIPVYISDEFISPFGEYFDGYGVSIKESDANRIDEILSSLSEQEIVSKQDKMAEAYLKYYTYDGAYNQIITTLEVEHHNRQLR